MDEWLQLFSLQSQFLTQTAGRSVTWRPGKWRRLHSRCRWWRWESERGVDQSSLLWENPGGKTQHQPKKKQKTTHHKTGSFIQTTEPPSHQQNCKRRQVVAAAGRGLGRAVDHGASLGAPASSVTYNMKNMKKKLRGTPEEVDLWPSVMWLTDWPFTEKSQNTQEAVKFSWKEKPTCRQVGVHFD